MKKNMLIRGVDDSAYRRAKAVAALKGVSVGAAVSEALSRWAAEERDAELEREVRGDRAFVRRNWSRFEALKGKSVVVAGGELRGVFDTYEEARAFSSRFDVALAFLVERRPAERGVEIGPGLEV